MAGDLVSTIAELRKTYYDDHLQEDVPKASPATELFMKKARRFELGGTGLNATMAVRNATGVGFSTLSEAGSYPTAGFQSGINPVVTCAHFAATVRWSGHVEAMGTSAKAQFQKGTVIAQNLSDLKEEIKKYIARMLMWDGTSILGTTAAASGTTGGYITLASGSAPIQMFEAGQILTIRNASTGGSELLTNAATGAGRILQIGFDTPSAPRIYLKDATGLTGGGGDYVAWTGVYDTTVISGLRAWVLNTGTFMGLARSTAANAALRSLVINSASASLGPTDADVLRDQVNDAHGLRGAYASTWLGSRRVRRSLIGTTIGNVRFSGLAKQEIGSPDVEINDKDGTKTFLADPYLLDTELFAIDPSKICYGSPEGMEGAQMVEHNGSSVFLGLASTIHADFKLSYATWRGNFGMDECRAAGKQYNFTPAT